jgi:hypothetical protein
MSMDGESIGQVAVHSQPTGVCDAAVPKRWPTADELLKNSAAFGQAGDLQKRNSHFTNWFPICFVGVHLYNVPMIIECMG